MEKMTGKKSVPKAKAAALYMNAATKSNSETNAGSPKTALLTRIRTKVWVHDLMARAEVSKPETLRKAVNNDASDRDFIDVRFDRYLNDERVPSESIRNRIYNRLSPLFLSSQYVYERGPEENGEAIPLWMMFEDGDGEFFTAIEGMLNPAFPTDLGREDFWGSDYMGSLFMPRDEWQTIIDNGSFNYAMDNPVLRSYEEKYFAAEFRLFAIVMGAWRLSMFYKKKTAAMEYLLHCLLEGPFKKKFEELGIHPHICTLVRALAVRNYLMMGNLEAANLAFPGLPIITA
jgi:hypothetical protein